MKKELEKKLNRYRKEHRLRNKRRLVISTLSLIVSITTTFLLMLPAITMETACGLDTHKHDENCYLKEGTQEKIEIVCDVESTGTRVIHNHDDYCYDTDGHLVCLLPETIEHSHSEACEENTKKLVCEIEESPGHIHDTSCYTERSLVCTQEEQEMHEHQENCYENPRDPICGLQENKNHHHTEECFEEPRTPVCEEKHKHDESCYEASRKTVCEKIEGTGHSHTDICYTEAERICSMEEGEGAHMHGDECFEVERIHVCKKDEAVSHTHTKECIDKNCTLQETIVHQHTADCIQKTEGHNEQKLTCKTPEHIHTEECYLDKESIDEIETQVHEESYLDENGDIICEKPEHEHAETYVTSEASEEQTSLPDEASSGDEIIEEQAKLPSDVISGENERYIADPYERSESAEYVENALSQVDLTGDWDKDVLAIAESQLGYCESITDYVVNNEGRHQGYTYYGDWYGIPYGDWCAMFVSFCLDAAEVKDYPYSAGCQSWIDKLDAESVGMWHPAIDSTTEEKYNPKPGDLIFYDFDLDGLSDHIGLVYELLEATEDEPALIKTIEGNYSDKVCFVTHAQGYEGIMGYGELPENQNKDTFEIKSTLENGVTVILNGQNDSLPFPSDEVVMTAKIVKESSSADQINSFLEENGHEYISSLCVDICLWHDGKEIQPTGPLTLSFAGLDIDVEEDKSQKVYVFHYDSEKEQLQDMSAQSTVQGNVAIETDHFSEYEVVFAKEGEGIRLRGYGDSGTISTVDSRADGITLNLFDYYGYNLDTWGNKVTSPVYNGINSGKTKNDLLFLGSGDEASGNGINNYTYGAIALQGIVNPTLTNGYPTLRTNNTSLSYLFNLTPNGNTKKVYADVNHLFQKDTDGYYRYDSDKNYAYYTSSSGGGNFKVYNNTYNNTDGTPIGFFPFNDYDTRYRTVKPDSTHYNHHFGMTMSASFCIPEDGKVNGKDMIFDFSGDDDVWVFIDDVLVLDIGGIHEAVHGQINFNTGAVTVSAATPASSAGGKAIGTSSTLEAIFAAAGKTYDGSDYSEHKISFFYLERGGCYSNCSLTFNLSVFQRRSLEIEKEIEGINSDELLDSEFQFKLYMGNGKNTENYTVYTGPARYSDGTPVVFSSDGTFRLKAGQRIIIPDIPDYKNYYMKELAINNELFPEVKINGQICQPIYSTTDEDLYEIESGTSNIKDRVEVVCTNVLPKPPKIDVEKLWQNSDGDSISPLTDSVSVELWRKYVVPESGLSHTVQFQVLSYNSTTQLTSPYLLKSVEVADGGSISFSSAVWAASSGATSTGGTVSRKGNYAFESWLSAPIYSRSNIKQDETITILFNVNGSNTWLFKDQIPSVRFHIIDYDKPQPTNPSAGSLVHELVDTVTLNDGNNWSYQWAESLLPAIHSSGSPYYYYVREIEEEGFETSYIGNDGITEGTIKIINIPTTVDLTIRKTVVDGSMTDEFQFEVIIKDKTDEIVRTISGGEGYTIGEDGKISFTLKHNESVTIKGIPLGSTATLSEIKHDGYTVLIKDGNQTLSVGDSCSFILSEHQEISVVNNAGAVLPETGGIGTTTYTLSGVVIMFAALVIGYRWRNKERRSVK